MAIECVVDNCPYEHLVYQLFTSVIHIINHTSHVKECYTYLLYVMSCHWWARSPIVQVFRANSHSSKLDICRCWKRMSFLKMDVICIQDEKNVDLLLFLKKNLRLLNSWHSCPVPTYSSWWSIIVLKTMWNFYRCLHTVLNVIYNSVWIYNMTSFREVIKPSINQLDLISKQY